MDERPTLDEAIENLRRAYFRLGGEAHWHVTKNGVDEPTEPGVVRVNDCEWCVFLDAPAWGRQNPSEIAQALADVLNAADVLVERRHTTVPAP